jgi:hypothetical protein
MDSKNFEYKNGEHVILMVISTRYLPNLDLIFSF